ncbi:MAG: hypothetical protein KGJ84_08655, partial [Elusimicrobia bacterium]|nr:hypothetical protein [Elusimicrobiota bacterium]
SAAPGALSAAPMSLSLPSLNASPAALAPVAAPVLPTAAVPAASVVPAAVARTSPAAARPAGHKPAAASVLALSARLSADPVTDGGRRVFDGDAARGASALAVAGRAAADGPRLARRTEDASAAAPKIPLSQRAAETAELGVMAAGFQLVTGLIFLALGAHAAFPALAGALWVLAGGELIKQLGNLRSVVVGGWQASHDQKMRTDYGTGKLIDIRGHKYGEDRYDQTAPGPVSMRERLTSHAAAFALGLPWVIPAGPKAVLLYVAGAAAAFGLRRLWRRTHPEQTPVAKAPDFEYDR